MLQASRKSHVETDRLQRTRFACAQSAAAHGEVWLHTSADPERPDQLSDHSTRRVAYLESVRESSVFRAPVGVSFVKYVVAALPYYFVPPLAAVEDSVSWTLGTWLAMLLLISPQLRLKTNTR
jgi:hypothetical protein